LEKSHNAEKTSASVALLIHRVLAVYVGIHGALFCALSGWGILSFFLPDSPVRFGGIQILLTTFAGIFMVLTPFQAFKTPEDANKTALVLGCLISLFLDGLFLTMLF
jgi:hypothetical protein